VHSLGVTVFHTPLAKGKIKAINLVLNSEVTLKEFVNPVAEEEAWIEEGLS